MWKRLRDEPTLQGLALWGGLRVLEFAFLAAPGVRAPAWPFHPAVFLADAALTAGLLIALAIFLSQLHRYVRLISALALSGAAALTLVSSALLYLEFGEYIHQGILMQLLDNPKGISGYLLGYIRAGAWMLLLPTWGFFYLALSFVRPPTEPSRTHLNRDRWLAVALISILFFGLNQLRLHGRESHLSPETSLGIAIQDTLRLSKGRKLRYSTSRVPLTPPKTPSPYNFLVILGESWGAEELAFFPSALPPQSQPRRYSMPELEAWLTRERSNVLVFPHAYSNSADTKVSVPSLMTGVSPELPVQTLHQAPFLWNWAQAAGLESIYITSQRYRWCGFREFFQRGFQGEFFTADDSPEPLVNDIGLDDAVSLAQLQAAIERVPTQKRFLAVYNPNAIHAPYQNYSALLPPGFSPPKDRLESAHRILDLAISGALATLERKGRLQNTFIFFTADHGTGASEAGGQARLLNYRDAVIRVPWMVRVPPAWKKSHSQQFAQASKNASDLIANIDLVPSVVNLLWDSPVSSNHSNSQAVSLLSGESIFEPRTNPPRTVISLSPIRPTQGERHGAFALLKNQWRLLGSTQTGVALYQTDRDPELRQNRTDSQDSQVILQELLADARKRGLLAEILKRTLLIKEKARPAGTKAE